MSTDFSLLTGTGALELVQQMGEAAADYLASLESDQRRKGVFSFADQEERTKWYYTPVPRSGLSLAEMDRRQRRLAHRLVSTGLSRSGYVAVSTIIGLETTLDALEGWRRSGRGRDPDLYYVSVFGTPDAREPWGWRFEGHHISLNYTIANNVIVSPTPTFFGANPADVSLGQTGTLRPLAGTEDLARDLLRSLAPEQRAMAILSPVAPSDILTTNVPHIVEHQVGSRGQAPSEALRYTRSPKGLSGEAMSPSQREMMSVLIAEYIHRMPDEIAQVELSELESHGIERVHFAWAGGLERRQPHYYRLQGRRFLVEYDNTQNDANHIHSVWRDPDNDFGAHLLARHYATAHK
jgi:hypothetical protein